MKATLEFNLPEDRFEFQCATKGVAMYCAINEIKNLFRSKLKYGELTDEQYKLIDEINEEFYFILEENNAKINE